MELEYVLDQKTLDWLTSKTGRSNRQTAFLYQLVDGDFEKLKMLEVQLKNCFLYYCPGDKTEVDKVMSMTPQSNYFSL